MGRKIAVTVWADRFEPFDGGHGGISHRYAPLIAWLAARLA